MYIQKGDALIIVDVQNDFLPGGALAVPNGNEIIQVLNDYACKFAGKGLPVFAIRDWHPINHCSFKEQGGVWPPHCIANTHGAQFSDKLKLPDNIHIISKAIYNDSESYSGFGGTSLAVKLTDSNIKRVFIGGLATDYCVKATVEDALNHGYITYYLQDASRAVNIKPNDEKDAEESMVRSGAILRFNL